ncbi:GGDEF domain-containing protein, partial [Roseisolibacter sp. H3M3-2]|uniref:GGDEF domain-containing protein n=1 Tax=Roseisolibacter sp. H3M3-2 TaxID=3031323 RepID=UPI0023DB7AA7
VSTPWLTERHGYDPTSGGRLRAAGAAAAEAREAALAMHSRELVRRAWEALADAQEADGRPHDALASYRRYKAMSDSLLDAAMLRRVATLEERAATERRERQIEALRHAQALSALEARRRAAQRDAVAAVAVLLAAAGVLAYRRRRRDARRDEVLALTDPLTGAANRRFVRERVARESDGGDGLAFLLLDVDHFKRVNDTYGHGAGDRLLAELAGQPRRAVGGDEVVVRWGGEEFLVVCRGASPRAAAATAARLRGAVAAHAMLLGGDAVLRVRCSVGFAVAPRDAAGTRWGWEGTVALADHALYAAKASGRDAWVGYSAARRLTAPTATPAPEHVAAWLASGALTRAASHDDGSRSAA